MAITPPPTTEEKFGGFTLDQLIQKEKTLNI